MTALDEIQHKEEPYTPLESVLVTFAISERGSRGKNMPLTLDAAEELARLRKIEAAAREYVAADPDEELAYSWNTLLAALGK